MFSKLEYLISDSGSNRLSSTSMLIPGCHMGLLLPNRERVLSVNGASTEYVFWIKIKPEIMKYPSGIAVHKNNIFVANK